MQFLQFFSSFINISLHMAYSFMTAVPVAYLHVVNAVCCSHIKPKI